MNVVPAVTSASLTAVRLAWRLVEENACCRHKRRFFAQARRAAGFTQESLAERLEVDRTTVARWESGEYSPQPWLRPKIAEALGLSLGALSELVDGADEVGTAEHRAGASTTLVLVKADGVHDEVPAAEQQHDRPSQEAELAKAFVEAQALQPLAPLPQVPWETDQQAVSTAHAIVASVTKATGQWEDRPYDQLKKCSW